MAPRPYENNFRVRLSKTGNAPAIYAISSGPQKGVHMLSNDPLPPSLQYLYRHPVNVHQTFLDISGDFLRRRFDSIDAASRWIDEMDASGGSDDLAAQLSQVSLRSAGGERRRDPSWRGMPEGAWKGRSEVLEGIGAARGFRIAKRATPPQQKGGYSRSHTGARRVEVAVVRGLQRRHSEADVAAAVGRVEVGTRVEVRGTRVEVRGGSSGAGAMDVVD